MSNPKGVDLSHFNVNPDFHTMAAAGIAFVYLKATEGGSFVDQTFLDRRQRAASVGLRTGAYHFFDPKVGGAAQAAHFLATLGGLKPGELPPALDLESTDGWDQLSQTDRVREVGAWLSVVENALGVRPVIYTSMGWWLGEFGNADFSGHPLWLAHYAASPGDTGLWKTWTAWQHGQYGTVPGAGSGNVDTDQWNGPLPGAA